jgi:general stress protein YciG
MKKKSSEISKYLSKIGRKGGNASSAAKAAAVRENGKKGGRPRTVVV